MRGYPGWGLPARSRRRMEIEEGWWKGMTGWGTVRGCKVNKFKKQKKIVKGEIEHLVSAVTQP